MDLIEDNDLFRYSVELSLKEWGSLQTCLDHGMGGIYAQEKFDWMIDIIKQYFINSKNNFIFEYAVEYIEEIMDNEFNTIIEDNSTHILVKKIENYFNLFDEKKFNEIRSILNEKLIKLEPVLQTRLKNKEELKVKKELKKFSVNSEDDEEDENINEVEIKKGGNVVDEDGWTIFGKK